MTIKKLDINVAHIALCKTAGKAAGVLYLAVDRLQSAIDAVRDANVVFGKSAATCPYKLALRNAITGSRLLSDAARDNLLSRVMAAIQSKSGEYVARKYVPLVVAATATTAATAATAAKAAAALVVKKEKGKEEEKEEEEEEEKEKGSTAPVVPTAPTASTAPTTPATIPTVSATIDPLIVALMSHPEFEALRKYLDDAYDGLRPALTLFLARHDSKIKTKTKTKTKTTIV